MSGIYLFVYMQYFVKSKVHKFLWVFVSLFWEANLWAFPSDPTPFTVDNSGDVLTLKAMGDEHFNYTQTLDGYLVIRNSNGVYYYSDENGTLSSFKAKNADNRNFQEITFLKSLNDSKVKKAYFEKHPGPLTHSRKEEGKASWVPSVSETLSLSSNPPALRLPSVAGYVRGTNRFPVLLVASSDEKNCDSTAYNMHVNQVGYSENGHIGSVKDYFRDQSEDIFDPTFDLFLVTVSGTMASYLNKDETLIQEALIALRTKYSNFDASLYDKDNDGEVDVVGVMYAGKEVNVNGKKLGGFAHSLEYYSIGKQSAGGRKKFNKFFILHQMGSNGMLMPIAQFVHEFCHTMGLMDHYCTHASNCNNDFTNSTFQAPGTHAWDVMSTGMYNGPISGATPIGLSAFEKAFLGWSHYDSLNTVSPKVSVLTPLNASGKALVVPVSGNKNEWFVLENRQKMGWDKNLPKSGLLIWHIDYDSKVWTNNEMNDDPAHQRVDVVEAGNVKINSYVDGFFNYEESFFSELMGYGKNLKDDPYPGSQNVTEFNGFNSWAGVDQGVRLYSITENSANGNVCFATMPEVEVGDCVASSSTDLESSSSIDESSNSEYSSSSEWNGSSSSMTAIVYSQSVQNSVDIFGSMLVVSSNLPGTKNIIVYDLSGRAVLQQSFCENELALNLHKLSGKMLIIKLSQNGKTLNLRKAVVTHD